MRRYIAYVVLLASVLLVQCQKEIGFVGTPDTGVVKPEPLTANVQGNVLDETGQPAAGVTITVGTKTAITDARGYFRINNAALDKNAALVSAEKAGYFKAFRTFSAMDGTNQVVIKLIKRELAGTINATTGGDVTLANGTKVALQPNGVVVAATGADYTGSINVYAAYIDPTAPDIAEKVPGSFRADDKDGKRVLLSSYGMVSVELASAAGEKLQVKTGFPATLTTPIPVAVQASAPESLPLWYVSEQTGIWKEEGTATKQGASYVGLVKHFTYWNCDIRVETINLKATLKNASGEPLVHASIIIKPATGNYASTAHGYTDSLGQINGPVPANMPLVLQVMDPCNNAIYSQNIGPYASNTDLGTITISGASSTSSVLKVTGTLLTCAGTNVVNGYAIVTLGHQVHYAKVENGHWATNFVYCSGSATSVQVLGVDNAAQQQGTVQTVAVTTPTTNAGSLSACGNSSAQYINYTLDGTNYSIATATGDSTIAYTKQVQGTTGYSTIINATGGANRLAFNFPSPTQAPGTYAIPSGDFRVQNYLQSNTVIPPFNVVITTFPQTIGEFYEGSLSGQFKDASGATHTLSGNFRVRRNM